MRGTRLGFLLAVTLLVAWACTVDRKSDGLACSVPTDCTAPRTCIDGYCLVDPDCPPQCSRCDKPTNTCFYTGAGGGPFTCPAGMKCDITCATTSACGDIHCMDAAACTISCSAASACRNVTCGDVGCTLECNGTSACGDVTCGGGDAGACAITCAGTNACGNVNCSGSCGCTINGCSSAGQCGTLKCPKSTGNTFCTASGADDEPCITTPPSCSC